MVERQKGWAVAVHTFGRSPWEAEAGRSVSFASSLIYSVTRNIRPEKGAGFQAGDIL